MIDPVTARIAWKLAPWALVSIMALALWGAYGYVTAAREARATAEREKAVAVAAKDALETKAREDQALLAAREIALAAAHKDIRKRDDIIRGFKPNEDCLTLDTPLPWLDGLLPAGAALRPAPDG